MFLSVSGTYSECPMTSAESSMPRKRPAGSAESVTLAVRDFSGVFDACKLSLSTRIAFGPLAAGLRVISQASSATHANHHQAHATMLGIPHAARRVAWR